MSKIWLVTGSAGGLGAGIAKAALAGGHQVVATDLHLDRLQQAYAGYQEQVLTAAGHPGR